VLRILVALTYYYPHWTGLTAYAQRLAEGFVRRGHSVTVVTSQFRRDLRRDDMHNGVHIVRIPRLFRLSRGQVMPTFFPVVARLLREHDVVQVHTPMLETWAIGMLAHRAGLKMVMTHHGDLVMPSGLWNQFVQRTVGYLLDKGAETADVITTHSWDYAEHSEYLRPHLHKLQAIYPPVQIPLPDRQAIEAWRRQLGAEKAQIVGFAGRFVEEKGFDYLLKAIPLIIERMPNVLFMYAGEHRVVYEDFYGKWRRLIDRNREHLRMLGLITDRQQLANFYGMCDLFALPSRTDCFPSVQVEAMLCGTPVVATDIPGAREAVKVTEMGLLVPPRDEYALAEGILEVLSAPRRYYRPRAHIEEIFNLDKTLEAYEQVLKRVSRQSSLS